MRRRRTVFATSWVVVFGCSQLAAEPRPSDSMDAPPCVPGRGHPCNPPPITPVVHKILDAKVISEDHVEGGVVFVAMLDNYDEVTTRFTGVFLDDNGPIQGTELAVKSVRKQYITCLLAGRDRLPSRRVRFYEPGAKR